MNPVPYGYIDLNADFSKLTTKEIIRTLNLFIEYGYRVIAINTFVDMESLASQPSKPKKKKSGPMEDPVPCPHTFDIPEDISNKVELLKRVTVKYSEPGQIIKLRDSKNFKQYQVFAVQPSTLNAFSHACSTLEVDLITLSCKEKLPFTIPRKMYQVAVQRGIHFELCYADLITSTDSRINCIQASHSLSIVGKSRGLILSSGSQSFIHIRSPHEVQCVSLMLGLSHVQAKQSIQDFPRHLLQRAYGRRLGKTLFDIQTQESQDDETMR
ncbi:hypothetical protein WDU94_008868 [Cyamophila willieti]